MLVEKKFFLFWAIAIFCWLTFLIPQTAFIWHWIDLKFFYFLNAPLKDSSFLQHFWAINNHRACDWIEDGLFITFYLIAIFKAPIEKRERKIAESLFCIAFIVVTIVFFNRFVFRDIINVKRYSPSLSLTDAVCLSDKISWISSKIASNKSFPGDHGTTALLFGFSYAFLNKGRVKILALTYSLFLCLPRLTVGAHWLTDIFIGSGSIVLLSMTLAFFTPLADTVITFLEKLFKKRAPSVS